MYIYTNKPHCVCFTETWVVDHNLPSFVNYRSFWKSRQGRRGGGLGLLIRSDIPTLPTNFIDHNMNVEVQKQTIQLKKNNL